MDEYQRSQRPYGILFNMTVLATMHDWCSQLWGDDTINSCVGTPDNFGVGSPQIDTNYVEGIAMAARDGFEPYIDFGSNQSSFWLHFEYYRPVPTLNTRATLIEFWSANKTLQYTLESSASSATSTAIYKSTNGTSGDVLIGSATISSDTKTVVDLRFTNDSSGAIQFYIDGTLSAVDYSGDTTTNGDNAVRYVTFRSRVKGEPICYSQVIASTQKTVGWKLARLRTDSTTGSPFQQWTGNNASGATLDTASPTGNSNFSIGTNTNDHTSVFPTTDIAAGAAGLAVKAVVVCAKCVVTHDATPTNARLCVYTSSTLAESSTKTVGYGNGEVAISNIWETNPVSGNNWTQSEVNAMFYGIKSKA